MKNKMANLSNVQVVFEFTDKSGIKVPLSRLQSAFLIRMMGFRFDKETGDLVHYTDKELDENYKIVPQVGG